MMPQAPARLFCSVLFHKSQTTQIRCVGKWRLYKRVFLKIRILAFACLASLCTASHWMQRKIMTTDNNRHDPETDAIFWYYPSMFWIMDTAGWRGVQEPSNASGKNGENASHGRRRRWSTHQSFDSVELDLRVFATEHQGCKRGGFSPGFC
jgi:hypothetical protein